MPYSHQAPPPWNGPLNMDHGPGHRCAWARHASAWDARGPAGLRAGRRAGFGGRAVVACLRPFALGPVRPCVQALPSGEVSMRDGSLAASAAPLRGIGRVAPADAAIAISADDSKVRLVNGHTEVQKGGADRVTLL